MHMYDALLSPVVGGIMTVTSGTAISYSAKKIAGDRLDEKKIPMMGVMGAFVFAAQMINFTIPGTGSSGHIGGGILLAALLGPFPAFLTLASVLLIQCLLFADGGLLAYGCNVFNLGVCTCLFAFTLIYKPIVKRGMNKKNIIIASVASVILGLQAGAFCVVLETTASGVTELPFQAFALLMQPIHLAIGLIEGLVTAAVLCFIYNLRPEILKSAVSGVKMLGNVSLKRVLVTFLIATVFLGGVLSLFASAFPDGLEWALERVAGEEEPGRESTVHDVANQIVDSTAQMPDYTFEDDTDATTLGTATAGIVGSAVTIVLAMGVGFFIHRVKKRSKD